MSKQLLTSGWLRRAQRLNPYYQQRLGWRVPAGWPSDVGCEAFADRVARFQHEHGQLTVDGALGPKTWAALQGSTWKPPARDHLVIAGKRVPVPFPVVTWEEPGGLSFQGQGGWRRRRDPSGKGVDLFVLHWDGCTSAHQCFHVLLERGLTVQLLLDGDGTVYQTLDLVDACAWHAGSVNERSVGIEIQNPVQVHRNQWQTPARAVIDEACVHRAGQLAAPRLLRHPEAPRRRARRGALRAPGHSSCAAHGRQPRDARARAAELPRRVRPLPRLANQARSRPVPLAWPGASFLQQPRVKGKKGYEKHLVHFRSRPLARHAGLCAGAARCRPTAR